MTPDAHNIDKLKEATQDALKRAETHRDQDNPDDAEKYTRMASTTQRMYLDAIRHADDAATNRPTVTVLWDESLTDDFMEKFLGPSPVQGMYIFRTEDQARLDILNESMRHAVARVEESDVIALEKTATQVERSRGLRKRLAEKYGK